MRYESIPRRISNGLTAAYKYLKEEFGNWAYILIAVFLFVLYKLCEPALRTLDKVSEYITYGVLGVLGLLIVYWFGRKIFR